MVVVVPDDNGLPAVVEFMPRLLKVLPEVPLSSEGADDYGVPLFGQGNTRFKKPVHENRFGQLKRSRKSLHEPTGGFVILLADLQPSYHL